VPGWSTAVSQDTWEKRKRASAAGRRGPGIAGKAHSGLASYTPLFLSARTAHPSALTVEHRDSALIARVEGDFDLATEEAYGVFLERVAADGARDVVVDLHEVRFMDSTGLRLLLRTDGLARERGQRLWIVGGGHDVRTVLRMTGMDSVLPLVDGVPDL
jgi:anti-sigma B factor antagonist